MKSSRTAMQCHTRIISLLFILCYLFYASILAIKCKQIIQANDRSHKLDHGLLKVVVVPLAKPFTVYVTPSHAQTHARDTRSRSLHIVGTIQHRQAGKEKTATGILFTYRLKLIATFLHVLPRWYRRHRHSHPQRYSSLRSYPLLYLHSYPSS